ncbi:hypothetical protein BCR33DRAFT_700354 [Rhizoclosmatium globosum]|uniref:Cilia- and flagella-associated protein 263 n=1 Tax=Rhizoclosmatium globosum TaxID=329046 RepID=A0A1Y2BW13_9FUNG|nr:hypothetical protein BCR33DRAFT_700354 [Rhizoclosmatium globosum]|eukprot:ORY38847.1 hypothetical protein BCR33DRAFT_700354 [Rhizoclosmatium globosum]
MDEHGNPINQPAELDFADFDTYSDVDLVRLNDELKKRNALLDSENKLFESYLARVNPANPNANPNMKRDATAMDEMIEEEKRQAQAQAQADAAGRREKKKKGEKTKEVDKPILLTPEQKSEIATRELEELRDEIEKQKEEWGKILDNYKAELEEVEIRVSDIKKSMYEFKRDIVQQAVNQRTGKVVAERVLRYFDDKIRSKDAIIEKVRLKNATLKVQKNKLHLQLKQKEEMGEVLHAIDFDQLQIENKQYLAKIEDRNAELLKLKMTAGNTVQILNFYKKKLQSLTGESQKLKSEIDQRREFLAKLNMEATLVAEETKKASTVNEKLREKMEEFRVPHVMEYVHIKAEQHELIKKVKSWERKVEIASMQAQRMKKIWHQMSNQGHSSRQANVQAQMFPALV